MRLVDRSRRGWRRARRRPLRSLAWLAALVLGIWVIGAPLWSARYPAMTDLPFHAAEASIIRHYFDPSWHFREQFTSQLFAVPYLTSYLVAVVAMFFVDAVVAIKIASAAMLALLPLGLGVLSRGMGKSPLLGVAGLALVWCGLTTWGFINYMGALGLFAAATGLALLQLRRPRRRRSVVLALTLVALFFTHPFRFPFAICAVIASVVLLYPGTRRWRPVLWPTLVPLAVFLLWWLTRPSAIAMTMNDPLGLYPERLAEMPGYLFDTIFGDQERRLGGRLIRGMAMAAGVLGLMWVLPRRERPFTRRELALGFGSYGVAVGCTAAFVLAFLVLPMSIGNWWYVYPREATAAAYLALALLPGLPTGRFGGLVGLGFVAWVGHLVVPIAELHVEAQQAFDEVTEDFTAILDHVPMAPKLLYLVVDHHQAPTRRAPWIHLPAYVQALKGGWLSFHFANFGATPMRYRSSREPGADVPPRVPDRWEWTPEVFDVSKHGAYFEWFLIRKEVSPWRLVEADPSIELVAHEGTWWLYRRTGEGPVRRRAR